MAKRRGRTTRTYFRLLARDALRNVRRLVEVKRKPGQLILVLNRPSFRRSYYYWRAWWADRRRRFSFMRNDIFVSSVLVGVGMVSIVFSVIQLSAVQTTPTARLAAIPAAPVPPKNESLPRSLPVNVTIPDIAVDTSLIQLGKNEDGSLETPESYDVAGWYKYSPTPGEIGPAIIVGHVDSYKGAAIFFRLRELQPGQKIIVTRADGSVAQFAVTEVQLYDQDHFPSDKVYGNLDYPGLRLITCGGIFNHLTGQYMQNTVVFARFVPRVSE